MHATLQRGCGFSAKAREEKGSDLPVPVQFPPLRNANLVNLGSLAQIPEVATCASKKSNSAHGHAQTDYTLRLMKIDQDIPG